MISKHSAWVPHPYGYDPYNSLENSYIVLRPARFKAGMCALVQPWEKDLFSAGYIASVANTNQAAGGIGG
jgi:hypothetical protein